MFPRGGTSDTPLTSPSTSPQSGTAGKAVNSECGQRKPSKRFITLPTLIIGAFLLMGTGFIIAYLTSSQRGGTEVGTKRNLSVDLLDYEFTLKDNSGDTTDEFVPGTLVDVSPKVNNTGDIDTFVFLQMEVPYGMGPDGSVIEFFQYQPGSSWTELEDCEETTTDYIVHIYAYETDRDALVKLEAGSITDPLFEGVDGSSSDIIVGNIGLLSEEDRTKEGIGLYFEAFGIQTSIESEGLTDSQVWERAKNGGVAP